jgi:glucokinase
MSNLSKTTFKHSVFATSPLIDPKLERRGAATTRLVGDIGGTNARFAWQTAGSSALEHQASYRCEDFATLGEAIAHYLRIHSLPMPSAFTFGVATPVTGDEVRMTNHHWIFSASGLRAQLNGAKGFIINDFVALACVIPALTSLDVKAHSHFQSTPNAPIALIGPGTGLGVATLFADGAGQYAAHAGEGGHVTLAASNRQEASIIDVLRERFGHVSAERAISGPGLTSIYEALCQIKHVDAKPLTPADVTTFAMNKSDPLCEETVAVFTSFLGNVAGNLALTIGAFGGVYVGGGIVPRLGSYFDVALFRKSFESKGRFADYLARIPSYVITCEAPALKGAAYYLDQQLAASS